MINDIFYELKHLEDEIKRIISLSPERQVTGFVPPMDIFEKEGKVIIYMDLPGFNAKDIKIESEGRHLKISGIKRIDKTGDKDLNFICIERKFGNFERRIFLGNTPDIEKIEAVLSKGVLKVTIPFVQEQAKKVEVKIKEEE
ncbi:HSP20 family protein [Thermotomaculum hydrothermale]|uniref:HSP20 family protein n=1 Tax=Thermotomaculum hydrothermale TaxID=981385 RepID=A0A7R6SYX2_9BACT|nr:Hsp20/alpha crystallin family protein [Thermotomaculum hydrothermale]BBB33031.1 HSP20 family protein [Thermotomaculum hydrothermale]